MSIPPSPASSPYIAVSGRGCTGYIHMDSYEYYGFHPGSGSVEECAVAVQAYDGRDGCQADYFFYEDAGYCNCPTDSCTEDLENTNAGGAGQLYKFKDACGATGAYNNYTLFKGSTLGYGDDLDVILALDLWEAAYTLKISFTMPDDLGAIGDWEGLLGNDGGGHPYPYFNSRGLWFEKQNGPHPEMASLSVTCFHAATDYTVSFGHWLESGGDCFSMEIEGDSSWCSSVSWCYDYSYTAAPLYAGCGYGLGNEAFSGSVTKVTFEEIVYAQGTVPLYMRWFEFPDAQPAYQEGVYTWDSAVELCESKGGALCTYDQMCPEGEYSATGFADVEGDGPGTGDNWTPYFDTQYYWVNTGTDRMCLKEGSSDGWHANSHCCEDGEDKVCCAFTGSHDEG